MQAQTPEAKRAEVGRLILSIGAAGILAAAWVALTIQTGLTYHLAPGLIAAVPGYLLSWSLGHPPSRSVLALVALAGVGFVAGGWAALEVADVVPTATFVEDQPGGVRAEVVVFALLGALLGVRAMLRARREED